MNIWKRFRGAPKQGPEVTTIPQPVAAPRATGFVPPPPRDGTPAHRPDERRDRLLKRRDELLSEIERAERASEVDNPWQQRLEVIKASLGAIEAEEAETRRVPTLGLIELPPTPIIELIVALETAPEVSFCIGGEAFIYREEIDWAERGHQLVKGDLAQQSGSVDALVPSADDPERADALRRHLDSSLLSFATDLRNRAQNGAELPQGATLQDLAQPCPECGDWLIWDGRCLSCLRRRQRLDELEAERRRLLSEQQHEFEDRARTVEQLPILRRRLAEINRAIESAETTGATD
jgi:hypothetical protein